MGSQFKTRVDQIYAQLDDYTYYELLNLSPTAAPDEIRTAFHRMAKSLHPDKFARNEDAELRREVYAIYKRMTEGYRVLMEPRDRRDYDTGLAQGQKRLVRTERKVTGPRQADAAITNPQARKFFNMAQDAERRGDLKSAKINFKFALDMEPGNATIQEHLDRVDAASSGGEAP